MSHKFLAPLIASAAVLGLSAAPATASHSALTPATAHSPRYAYTDLGVLGGLDSHAWALNDGGQVVGDADTCPGCGPTSFHAFLWTPNARDRTSGAISDLGTLRGDGNSTANGINGSSLVVGESLAADFSTSRAFVYNGTMHNLGGFGGQYSAANSINAAGDITGYSKTPDGYDHAFLWIPKKPDGVKGKMYDLGTLPGQIASIGASINGAGTVVGSSLDADYLGHPFIWRPDTPNGTKGTMTELPEPAGVQYSGPSAINNSGLVVGSMITATGEIHAFLYNGTMHDLGTLPGGTESAANSINSSGVAAGYSETAVPGSTHAVLFTGGRVIDLNRLLPGSAQAAGVGLVVAHAISDSGQIAGYAIVNGHAHGFLLTPLPSRLR